MESAWEKKLACARQCHHCRTVLGPKDPRILSVFDHEPICASCKRVEEKRPDYADRSKQMIAGCIAETGRPYGEPAGYCFHHFCPFTCKE
jgi:hypothetical protein